MEKNSIEYEEEQDFCTGLGGWRWFIRDKETGEIIAKGIICETLEKCKEDLKTHLNK